MKKILIFSLAYYPHVGGAEVAIKEITDRLRDIEFHMVTLRFSAQDAAEETLGNVRVHRIGRGSKSRVSKFLFQFAAAYKGSQLQKKHQFDGVWAMMAHSSGVPAALFNWRYPRVPYILNLQEGDPFPQIERTMLPLWPLFVRAFTKAAIVQPLSQYLADWARRRGFTGPIEIIPNGADVQFFSGERVAHPGVVLVSTSRLVHKNALDDVIRAVALLPPHVLFRNYGFGPDKEKLELLAREMGVEDRVELLPHPGVPNLPQYLHAADIFIRPSRSEGFGISFIEAMAARLPVIATQEGGIADFLFDARRNPDTEPTGWAVDRDSPEQIAAAVQEILAYPDKTKVVVEHAYRVAAQKYDWGLIAHTMQEKVFARLFAI